MKVLYIAPVTKVTFVSPILMITDSTGHNKPEESLGKETSFEEENETGIPDGFTNIWGDEEEKED